MSKFIDDIKKAHKEQLDREGSAYKERLKQQTCARVDNDFTHHTPKGDQVARYTALRAQGKLLALDIVESTPPSREQALALTKLEEAIMWANAAIARNE